MSENELLDDILELIKIIEKAASMEHEAHIFYSDASMRSPTKEGKNMFKWLADFEKNHEEKLNAQKQRLIEHPLMKGVDPPKLDADYKVSEAGGTDALPPEPSETDILKVAIMNEKKAYSFYQRKLTHAADDEIKDMFARMASEEEKHIKILSECRQRLITDHIWGDIEAFRGDLDAR